MQASGFQRRPHMTKEQRLPKCYKEVEKVIHAVKSCKINYKTHLANSRLPGGVYRKVYGLTVEVLKHFNYIQKIIEKLHLLEKEEHLRRELASILIYEIIFGSHSLHGESKPVTLIKKYESDIRYTHKVLQNANENFVTTEITIPRYARVHTLVTTVPYVLKDLKSCGYNQIFYDEHLSEDKYLELVKKLEKGSFLIDFHFKDVLVFHHSENLINIDLYKNGHIFLQDKSSCIPVHVLNPIPGSIVFDACAAPGMKTAHMASQMKNKGVLYACDRDKSRFESLKQMLECGSVKICRTLCKDFKLVDPYDQAYSNVEYILLDPSCSGSGMVNRLDEVTDTEDSKNKQRLTKLAGFQIILLKHALKFPSVKRVVYSTCSIHEEENEYVVHEALQACIGAFKLVPAMPEWSNRGSENYEYGKLCLRTVPENHLTNGFFVAMFERISPNEHTEERYSARNKTHDMRSENTSNFETRKRKFSELESGQEENEVTESDQYHGFSKQNDYSGINLKQEWHEKGNYSCEKDAKDNYIPKKKKKHKKEKISEFVENSNEFMSSKTPNELTQSTEYTDIKQLDKCKKKKHYKEDKSDESGVANNSHFEKIKSKYIENALKTADIHEDLAYNTASKKKHSKTEDIPYNKCHVDILKRNNKCEDNDHQLDGVKVNEKITNLISPRKKKKYLEQEYIQMHETQILPPENIDKHIEVSSSNKKKKKKKYLEENIQTETQILPPTNTQEFIDVSSSNKRKKKKKYSN